MTKSPYYGTGKCPVCFKRARLRAGFLMGRHMLDRYTVCPGTGEPQFDAEKYLEQIAVNHGYDPAASKDVIVYILNRDLDWKREMATK